MDKNALEMRRIITTVDLRGDQLLTLDTSIIQLWIKACNTLIGVLKTEEMLLTGIHSIAKVKDDIQMTTKNIKTLTAVDKLIGLELNEFISMN